MGRTHIAQIASDGSKEYFGTNHLGSTTLLTDEDGEVTLTDETTPFGDQENKDMFYTGKKWDEDAQLYYFNARWYDPETARFVTEDPIKDGSLWFAYVGNNPMGFVDFTGLNPNDMTQAEREMRGIDENSDVEGDDGSGEDIKREGFPDPSETPKFTEDDLTYQYIGKSPYVEEASGWYVWLDDTPTHHMNNTINNWTPIELVPPPEPKGEPQEPATSSIEGSSLGADEQVSAAEPSLTENVASEDDSSGSSDSSKRYKQNIFNEEEPDGPCLFRTLIAAVEEKTGKNFTKQELLDFAKSSRKKGYIGNTDPKKGPWWVEDPINIIKGALSILEYPNAIVTLSATYYDPTKANGDMTIRRVITGHHENGDPKIHFQLGTAGGTLLWDPFRYDNSDNAYISEPNSLRDITIDLIGGIQ